MNTLDQATFGAGCFWGVEELFRIRPGVIETAVGYMGGTLPDPTYQDVCMDTTGHTEVVTLRYDPALVTYDNLLQLFWENHDPTEVNRQGPDIGSQYRSVIFYHTQDQQDRAENAKSILETSGKFNVPIVTEILPAATFYPAEDYHQKYLMKRGQNVCH